MARAIATSGSLVPRHVAATVRAYLFALICAGAGLAVTALTAGPFAGPFFMFQFAAVVGATLYGGLGPGFLTMAVSGVGFFFLFFAPTLEPYELYRLTSFALVSVIFAWLAARLRRARADAVALAAFQERIVAIVSHDLRNPLNAIALTTVGLQRRSDLSKAQAIGVARIGVSAHRMQGMIHDLLDFARSRRGTNIPVRTSRVRLGDVCAAALEELRSAYPARSVVLDVSCDDSVIVDPARVEQVVCNLVTNAFNHGSPTHPVTVNVLDTADAVRLDVTNQGPAIAAELLPTMFEAFRAGDAPASVGLGLFIVREIARAHGGSVSVQSDESAGTTFTVLFPRASPVRGAKLVTAA
jgi:signal transduction histidine kinase